MFEISVSQTGKSPEVLELLALCHIIALKVQDGQFVQERNVEQLIDLIVRDVKLFQLLERLDALDFPDLTPGYVEHSHVFETSADVSETADHGVIQLEQVQLWHNFPCNLQVVMLAVDSELYLRHERQVIRINAEREGQKLFVEVNYVFDLLLLDDAQQLVLKVLHYDHAVCRGLGWFSNFVWKMKLFLGGFLGLCDYLFCGLFFDKLPLRLACGYLRQILIGIQTVLPTARCWHLIHRLHAPLLQLQQVDFRRLGPYSNRCAPTLLIRLLHCILGRLE